MKKFNTTGLCVPRKHYMVDISNKLRQIEQLVNDGEYFTINRGRQYGKTTTFALLERSLRDKYLVLATSFEAVGDAFATMNQFASSFIRLLSRELVRENVAQEIVEEWNRGSDAIDLVDQLGEKITTLCKSVDKEVVVMIDEVDKSSNNQLFLFFLGMLRNKYLDADNDKDVTFHSVILAGVYDVKNLKLKLRPEDEKKFNSPWNIAADFEVDMSFNPDEIATMLVEYENDHKTGMNIPEIADEIHYYTSGYPFLVSRLCKTIDEKLSKDWTPRGVKEAVNNTLNSENLLFDDLFKNLENYRDLYDLIYAIMVDGKRFSFDLSHPMIKLSSAFAIIKNERQTVEISNLIFESKLYTYFTLKREIADATKRENGNSDRFSDNVVKNGRLNMELLLTKFAEFLYSEHRERDQKFIEREGRLLFLCFLKPIINGGGFYFVEPETRHDRRMDIVVVWGTEKFVLELKIWYGENKLEEGYAQLADYLDSQKLDTGYLLTFNFNKVHESKTEWLDVNGKKIFSVMV
ncbi:MAG: AAA family ATPase [Thermoguttaceae bacterium]